MKSSGSVLILRRKCVDYISPYYNYNAEYIEDKSVNTPLFKVSKSVILADMEKRSFALKYRIEREVV